MNDAVMQREVGQAVQAAPGGDKQVVAAGRIISKLFEGFGASVEVDLWGQQRMTVGSGRKGFSLKVNDPECVKKMVLGGGPLSLAEAHFRGEIDYEGDIYEVLALRNYFQSIDLGFWEKLKLLKEAAKLGPSGKTENGYVAGAAAPSFRKSHSRKSDSAAVQFHYDVSNEFYRTWLDSMMVYSCGYFESADDGIDKAQENKLDHVCSKLQLKSGERFLDIGCGWGAMVCWAAKHYGVKAHGITLSDAQLQVAEEHIRKQGLSSLVTVEKRDYRDLQGVGVFDKVSSIGMFEHVGLKGLKAYNETVFRVLSDDGLFLNHGITHAADGWDTGLNSKFLQKYVFPDGELDRVSNIANGMESAGFEIIDVENLRFHYARTLREWVKRLEENRRAAQGFVGEQRFKIWRMYMAGSALEFEEGRTGIHQILGAKWKRSQSLVPATRKYMY
jgi:cyclopropane-fatty-acyl-phospholipid synthase